MRTVLAALATISATVLLVGCSGSEEEPMPTHRIIQGAAPGQMGEVLTEMPTVEQEPVTADEVAFVRHMIVHHGQALEMTELVPTNGSRDDVALFAERINLSQEDEIRLMQEWLQDHRLTVLRIDDEQGGHAGHGAVMDMPGMITPEQLDELAAAQGPEFDRMFLELMFDHHEGAVLMVEDLQQGQQSNEPVLWNLVKDIDGDQRIEMDRIVAMLADMNA